MVMFLVHHSEEVTIVDLIKWDMDSKDLILKHESIKVWNAINGVGMQIQQFADERRAEFDEKLDSELEVFNTKLSKQMSTFF